jgi:hypothetical protein
MPGWTPDNPSYGDWRYHTGFGTGSNWAQWEATNVTPGQYEVYVTWAPFNNRASNALYTIYDGGPAGTVEGAFQLDQENPPRADVTAGGRPFQLLGTYLIDSTSLSVRLTDDANGYVIADAVRFVRVGDLPPKLVVEIPVSVATEPGGTVVATVTRLYGGTLTDLVVALGTSDASEATADPVTVTIPAGSSSTTFNVLVQDDNLADRTQTVTITATAVGFVPGTDSLQVLDDEIWTIDDEDPGYSETPVWTEAEVAGYPGYAGIGDPSYGDWRYRPAGDGSSVATWQVTTGRPGQYEVFVTWAPFTNRAPNAPYKVYDGPAVGGTLEGTFPINQQNAPVAHVTFGGRPFQRLGTFTISSTTLAVTLSNLANNYVIADAVQFARVGDGPLRAAGGAAAGGAAAALTAEQAQGLLAEAAGRWQSAGLAADVQLVIADLPGDLLGMASSADQTIWLDADAAGYGWYVDATPWEDEEFDEEPDEEAADRMDALSVIFHELGHLQGLADVDGLLHPDDRMADLLAVGVRRAFASADHDAALAELLGDGQ